MISPRSAAEGGRRLAQRDGFPESTYRLQFHAGFTFRDARAIVPYLRELGITHCYASPYLKARPGQHSTATTSSTTAPSTPRSAPRRTTTPGRRRLQRARAWARSSTSCPTTWASSATRTPGGTTCWRTARRRRYAGYFDIAWQASPRPELPDRVLLPVLGEPYGEVLEARQLRLAYEAGAFTRALLRPPLPVAPHSYAPDPAAIGSTSCSTTLGADVAGLARVPEHPDRRRATSRRAPRPTRRRWPSGSARRRSSSGGWPRLTDAEPAGRAEFIEQTVAALQRHARRPATASICSTTCSTTSAYRLAYWRVASDEINYRRFFDINDLAALSMERAGGLRRRPRPGPAAAGRGQGRRAAHRPPRRPVRSRRSTSGGSRSTSSWPAPDAAFEPRPESQRPGLEGRWKGRCLRDASLPRPARAAQRPARLAAVRRRREDPRRRRAAARRLADRTAPAATTSSTASTACSWTPADATAFTRPVPATGSQDDTPLRRGRLSEEVADPAGVALQRAAHAGPPARPAGAEEPPVARLHPQQPAPRPARGDRLLPRLPLLHRRRGRLTTPIASYVVKAVPPGRGAQPAAEPVASSTSSATCCCSSHPESFDRGGPGRAAPVRRQVPAGHGAGDGQGHRGHRLLRLQPPGVAQRGRRRARPLRRAAGGVPPRTTRSGRRSWPHALSPLSTHDTKRERGRPRPASTSCRRCPSEWAACVERWSRLNEPHRSDVDDGQAPGRNEEYLLYQTLVGAWPLGADGDRGVRRSSCERIQEYMAEGACTRPRSTPAGSTPTPSTTRPSASSSAASWTSEAIADFLDDFRAVPAAGRATTGCSTRCRRRC